MFIFTKSFWDYAGERAVKTFAQTATALFSVAGVSTAVGGGTFDWIQTGAAVLVATSLSILTAASSYQAASTITTPASNTTPAEAAEVVADAGITEQHVGS